MQYLVKRKYAVEGLTTTELCEKLYEVLDALAEMELAAQPPRETEDGYSAEEPGAEVSDYGAGADEYEDEGGNCR